MNEEVISKIATEDSIPKIIANGQEISRRSIHLFQLLMQRQPKPPTVLLMMNLIALYLD